MEFKRGDVVKHKFTGQEGLVLEVGPSFKNMMTPNGPASVKVLESDKLILRLRDMRLFEVFEFEVDATGKEVEAPKADPSPLFG